MQIPGNNSPHDPIVAAAIDRLGGRSRLRRNGTLAHENLGFASQAINCRRSATLKYATPKLARRAIIGSAITLANVTNVTNGEFLRMPANPRLKDERPIN